MFAGRKRGRIRKHPRREECSDQRVAAFRIVYAAVEAELGQNPFEAGAMAAAADAVIRHPHAGDEQIMAFLRWFVSDENPMP